MESKMGFFYLIFFDNVFLLQLLYWKVVHRKYTDFLQLLLEQHGLHGLWCSFAIILKHPLCRHKCILSMAVKCSHSIANALNRFTIKYHFPKMCSSASGFHFSPSMQLTNGSVTAEFTRNGRSVEKKKIIKD